MPSRGQPIHVATTVRKYNGKEYKTHLLRRTYRDGGKVRNETVGNISHLPEQVIEMIRLALKGEALLPATEAFEKMADHHHGHVQAVLDSMQQLGFANLVSSEPCRERDLVLAMVAARILAPGSKLATTRWWHVTTIPQEFGVESATEDELYAALDWLLKRQARIEKKLAKRHLVSGGLVLYDLTSTYVEGEKCPLAVLGYSRDGKRGTRQVMFGLLADSRGCPVAVTVYPGNTMDFTTLLEQVGFLKETFAIDQLAIVGDRGTIAQKQIDSLKGIEGVDWIAAFKSPQIRKLVVDGYVQLGLFDENNLFEFTHPDYPKERLIACRNPELAKLRAFKRQDLLQATAAELAKVQRMVDHKSLLGKAHIALRVGEVANKFKVRKHFDLDIQDASFRFAVAEDRVAAEAALDGIYIIRTSINYQALPTNDVVRSYKLLAGVERAFRSLKTIDLKVRPIHHYTENRVCAHIFLCMLAYYVEWHMREAWRELILADDDLDAKKHRDPVAPAKRSTAALAKVHTHQLDDGTQAHSFRTLLTDLSGIVRSTCRRPGAADAPTFRLTTQVSPERRRAFELLQTITA